MSIALRATLPDRQHDDRPTVLATGPALLTLDCIGFGLLWPVTVLMLGTKMPGVASAAALVVYPIFAVAALYALGLYRRDVGASLRRALSRVPVAATLGALAASGALLLFAPEASRLGLAAGGCVLTAAAGARVAFDSLRRRGVVGRRILILGAGPRAWDLVHILGKEGRTLGYDITFLHDAALGSIDPRLAHSHPGAIRQVGPGGIREAAIAVRPDEIVVAPDDRRGMDLHGLLQSKIAGFAVSDYLGFLEREVRRVDIKRIELGWLLYSDGFNRGILDRMLKRMLDLAGSMIGLLVFAPFLAAAMIAIRLQDGGPALDRQTRITSDGREFPILKLRTTWTAAGTQGAAWGGEEALPISRLDRLLRWSGLDDVPQLVNILRGEMSFVGPRPERPEFVAMLAGQLPLYCERHTTKPGLTGWAQVNYPYGTSIDDARSRLSYDLYYVKNASFLLDLLILLQTARVVLWPGSLR